MEAGVLNMERFCMNRYIYYGLFILIVVLLISAACTKDKSCVSCIADNTPPSAVAGPDQAITLPTDSILLDGSASRDLEGMIISYQNLHEQWEIDLSMVRI